MSPAEGEDIEGKLEFLWIVAWIQTRTWKKGWDVFSLSIEAKILNMLHFELLLRLTF